MYTLLKCIPTLFFCFCLLCFIVFLNDRELNCHPLLLRIDLDDCCI